MTSANNVSASNGTTGRVVFWPRVCGNSSQYDAFWSDALSISTQQPDLTTCFQDTVLVWVPCGVFLLAALVYLRELERRAHTNNGTRRRFSGFNKLKTCLTFLLLLVVFLDLLKSLGELAAGRPPTPSKYIRPGLQTATMVAALAVTRLEYRAGVASGGPLVLLWFALSVLGIPQFRSIIITYDSQTTPYIDYVWRICTFYVYYFLVVVLFLLGFRADVSAIPDSVKATGRGQVSLAEEHQPLLGGAQKGAEKGQKDQDQEPIQGPLCPEVTAPFWSRVMFLWITKMIFLGYRQVLTFSDLWVLNPVDRCDAILPVFEQEWQREVDKTKFVMVKKGMRQAADRSSSSQGDHFTSSMDEVRQLDQEEAKVKPGRKVKKPSFWCTIVRSIGGYFMMGGIWKLIYDVISFINPQILNLLITFIATRSVYTWQGYLLAVLLFVVAMARTVILQQYWHVCFVVGMRLHTAVTGMVYRKAMRLSPAARKGATVGEIVNIMSVDSQKLQDAPGYLHMLWSTPLTIALAMYFLWQQLGPSVLAGLALMVVLVPINAWIAQKTRKLQVKQMRFKDGRIKLMNEVLNGIKVLKLYAWEDSFRQRVLSIRDDELRELRSAAFLSAFSALSWFMAPYLVALGSFGVYVTSSPYNVLDANKAFVSLSLFNLINYPISMLPIVITIGVQAAVSIGRITKFLHNEEIDPDNVGDQPVGVDSAVEIESGKFSWAPEDEPTLRDINLQVKRGHLVGVVGTVGSGKSSLVSSILGEMHKLNGQVNVRGSVAYVPQQAWIQNETVRNNIYFGKTEDPAKYRQVVAACALEPDLKILPGGDETEIGEKGINLSGGQKQRVSLARAVYQNTDVYLLDDPLSAVDSHVGKHIFDEVIGNNGLLKNKTRILVTNSVAYLPRMDQIVVLRGGRVTETGSYSDLIASNGGFADYVATYFRENSDDSADVDDEDKQVLEKIRRSVSALSEGQHEPSPSKSRRTRSSVKSAQSGSKVTDGATKADFDQQRKKQQTNKLIEDEVTMTGSVKLSVFTGYLSTYGVLPGVFTLLFYVVLLCASAFTNIWLSWWSTDPVSVNGTQDASLRNLRLGVYGGLGVVQALCTVGQALGIAIGCISASRILHTNLLARIMRAPMSFFDTTPLGRIVNRCSRDVDVLDINIPMRIRIWLATFSGVITTVFIICYSTPIFLSVFLPLMIFYYFVQRFYVSTSRQLKRIDSVRRSPIYNHFGESISGTSSIRAYNQVSRFVGLSDRLVDENQMAYYPNIISNRWLGIWLEFIGNLVVLFASIFAVVSKDTIDAGLVGLSVSYALQVTGSLNMMVRMACDMENYVVAVERIQEYTDAPQEAPAIVEGNRPSRGWPTEGNVSVEQYATRYRPGLELVLNHISFNILPQERVGIVGRTGAGKSSLTLALFRIIEAAGGKITIDGVDISKIGLTDLRSKLTIIPQDPVLFSGTLRMNLDPFDRYTDAEIWQALDHAHLRSFVESVSGQLQYMCTEGGDNLSVGQRQLVCLARALLRKTKILVLDEATAAVDLETDDLIQNTIRDEFSDATIITIAHRLNTIMDYSRVLVLDAGKIVEFDSPATLLENKDGVFYGMAKDAQLL